MKRIILALSVLLFSSFALASLDIGEKPPAKVSLKQLNVDGSVTEHDITDKAQGRKFVVLDFFQTNCGACQVNLPRFSKLAKAAEKYATFRSVALDRNQNLVVKYVETHADLMQYDVALDFERKATKVFEVAVTPTMFILDSDNTVVYKHEDVLDDTEIAKILKLVGAQ